MEELLKLYRDGPRLKNLSIVISLNGINDYVNPQVKRIFILFNKETVPNEYKSSMGRSTL